jgi:hypothetical protein
MAKKIERNSISYTLLVKMQNVRAILEKTVAIFKYKLNKELLHEPAIKLLSLLWRDIKMFSKNL